MNILQLSPRESPILSLLSTRNQNLSLSFAREGFRFIEINNRGLCTCQALMSKFRLKNEMLNGEVIRLDGGIRMAAR